VSGSHIVNGKFQSDKYPTCPPGKVPLSVEDPNAQDLLWEYAQRRRKMDAEFSDDLETALKAAGYKRPEWEVLCYECCKLSGVCGEAREAHTGTCAACGSVGLAFNCSSVRTPGADHARRALRR
jgi:hypothetical protein